MSSRFPDKALIQTCYNPTYSYCVSILDLSGFTSETVTTHFKFQ